MASELQSSIEEAKIDLLQRMRAREERILQGSGMLNIKESAEVHTDPEVTTAGTVQPSPRSLANAGQGREIGERVNSTSFDSTSHGAMLRHRPRNFLGPQAVPPAAPLLQGTRAIEGGPTHNDDVGATGIPITPEYEQGSSKLGSKDSQHQSSQFGSFLRDASRSRRNKSPQVSPRELRKLSWRQNDGGDTEALAQQEITARNEVISMLKQIRHLLGDGTKVVERCKKLRDAVPFQKLQLKTLQDLAGLVDEVENVCFNFAEEAVNLRDGLAEVRDEAEERVLAMLEEIETQSGGQVSHQGPGVSTMSYPSSPVANKDDGRSRQQEDGLPTSYSHTTVQSGMTPSSRAHGEQAEGQDSFLQHGGRSGRRRHFSTSGTWGESSCDVVAQTPHPEFGHTNIRAVHGHFEDTHGSGGGGVHSGEAMAGPHFSQQPVSQAPSRAQTPTKQPNGSISVEDRESVRGQRGRSLSPTIAFTRRPYSPGSATGSFTSVQGRDVEQNSLPHPRMNGSFYAKNNSEIYNRGMMGLKDDRAIRNQMTVNDRRLPIGTCPSMDYGQRIRKQYKDLSVTEMRQRVQERKVQRETRKSFRLVTGHLEASHDYARDILFDESEQQPPSSISRPASRGSFRSSAKNILTKEYFMDDQPRLSGAGKVATTGTWGESFSFPQVPTPHIDVEHRHGGAPIEGRRMIKTSGEVIEVLYQDAHDEP